MNVFFDYLYDFPRLIIKTSKNKSTLNWANAKMRILLKNIPKYFCREHALCVFFTAVIINSFCGMSYQ